ARSTTPQPARAQPTRRANPLNSPKPSPPQRKTPPPKSNCMPAKVTADTPVACRCPTREPAAHDNADPSSSKTIAGSTNPAPDESWRNAMRATPASPGTSPNRHEVLGRRPAGVAKLRNANQKGTVAKITAAKPDGTYCCA